MADEDFLTKSGAKLLSLGEAQQLLEDKLQEGDDRVDLSEQSFLSTILNIFADVKTKIRGYFHNYLLNLYIPTATGIFLDYLVVFKSIYRKSAQNSFVDVEIEGYINTVIPISTLCVNKKEEELWCSQDYTIKLDSGYCIECDIVISNVLSNQEYSFFLNGNDVLDHKITYFSGNDATEQSILEGIFDVLEHDTLFLKICTVEKQATRLIIKSKTYPSNPFTIQLGDYLNCNIATLSVRFVAIKSGPVDVSGNSISLKNNIAGVISAKNTKNGVLGRNIETDQGLRDRYNENIITEIGTKQAIKSALLNKDIISGITFCDVVNTQIGTYHGFKVVAIETVVDGGEDQKIAQVIQDNKTINVFTTGNTVAQAIDRETGESVDIYFTRPVGVYIWVKVEIRQALEGQIPDNYGELIQSGVMEYSDTITTGDDVNVVYLRNKIVNKLKGLRYIDVKVAKSDFPTDEPQPADYEDEELVIDAREVALFSDSRIVMSIMNS